MAAHVVAFALITALNPSRAVRRTPARSSSIIGATEIGKLTRRCGAAHTGASPPRSYKSSGATRNDRRRSRVLESWRPATDRKRLRDADRDDAADASRFFSRIGYVVLAVGAPVGVVLHPLGLYVMFSIGVGLILIAAALDAEPGFLDRVQAAFLRSGFSRACWRDWSGRHCRFYGRRIRSQPPSISLKLGVLLARDNAGCGGAARERGRDRPLSVPDRRRSLGMGTMAVRALIADAERDGGRWPAYDWRDRDRRPAFPGDRRSRGARTQRTRRAFF